MALKTFKLLQKQYRKNIINIKGDPTMEKSKDNLTRSYIFEAYYELLKKQQCSEISVSDICEKAGVSRMSFYRNFKSKEDLISKSVEKIMQELKSNLLESKCINQYIVTREIFSTAKKYRDAFISFRNSNYAEQFVDTISEKLFSFAPQDIINPSRKYTPIFFFSALAGVLNIWIKNGTKESPEEMAKLICEVADFPFFSDEHFHIN